ncbi:GNAT family N-acetyltransferase [Nocardioides marmorisolisilvae]|uniref:N-acetyltransferase n=1 Tax=Nocardioides marmorisolisilvae TaxID=1542737 RepID=A0A3N0DTI2_9ACTN|nr:GNAT family N-acetyltransferase [Nocardioides marmorisolisilvae]RNL78945.1 N-acetyltransferase [Nocardioides marmorisolisilvae]
MRALTTERLLLRQWRDDDREPFAALNADPEVMADFPRTVTREEADALIDRHQVRLAAGEPGLFAVEVRDSGEFIGFVGLSVPAFEAAFTPCVEVGWRLARSAWGHGYASEGGRAALEHGFNTLMLNEIVSFTWEGNLRSRAVMERIGMTRDPADDFEHPNLEPGHRLRPHVLYRVSRS